MKKLLLLLLLPMMIYANPTSGWQDSINDTGGWLFLVGAWALIFIVGGLSLLKDKIFKQTAEEDINKETDIIENEIDIEEDIGKIKEQMLKGFNSAFVEKNNNREFNNMDDNKKRIFNSRDYFYISIILILLIALYSLYTQYQNDSYTRVMDCFRDEVKEPEFCQEFYEQFKE